MNGSTILAVVVLPLAVTIGLFVHELLHALVLRTAGIEYKLAFGSNRNDHGHFRTLVSGSLAAVQLQSVPPTSSSWHLRLAAMAPLAMLLPVGVCVSLVAGGVLSESLHGSVALVGWMACALPSPADFAIAWHPEETQEHLGGQDADDE